jgi:voltage-gated potassium channel
MATAGHPDNLMRLRSLYDAEHPTAHRFRYVLLIFDIAAILFIVASSFAKRTPWLEAIDVVFGIAIRADFAARLFISRTRIRDLLQPATWADMLLPAAGAATPPIGSAATRNSRMKMTAGV